MATQQDDLYKQKFRPDIDPALDQEIEAALGDLSIDALYDAEEASKSRIGSSAPATAKGSRRGKVIRIDKNDIFVDFGGKSQGIVSRIQFEEEPIVGDDIELMVERYDASEGLLILTRKGATAGKVTWDNLEVGQIVEGTVTGLNKGGLELDVKGMRAFMPSGQVEIYFQKDLSTFIGQKLTAEVTQFEKAAKNLILSRRNILEREKEEAKQKLLLELAEGQTRRGTVRSVMDFGAFVDLGGIDGLIHVSEMSYRRGRPASEFVKVGDLVEVKVIKIDKQTGKLSLSLKQAMPDPWTGAEGKFSPGTTLTGRVTRVESFGAFVEVEEGLEGLLPVSEISWQRIGKPSDVVKEGDTLKLVVLSIDPLQKRMSLSLKQAGPDPWSTVNDRYATEMVVPGKVTRVVEFGAFVELEPGLEGLAHISELSDKHVKSAGSIVKVGQDISVRVLEIDKDARRMSLSIRKAAEPVAAAATAQSAPVVAEKRKRPQLRGGLDWGWK